MRNVTVTLPPDSWPHVLKALEIAADVKASESRDVAEAVIRETRAAIKQQVEEFTTNRRLTREETAASLAAHYSRKLNGAVACSWDAHKRAYCIHGEALPAHPDLVEQYPNGWSMLDFIAPGKVREVLGGSR